VVNAINVFGLNSEYLLGIYLWVRKMIIPLGVIMRTDYKINEQNKVVKGKTVIRDY